MFPLGNITFPEVADLRQALARSGVLCSNENDYHLGLRTQVIDSMKVLPRFHDLPLAGQLVLWATRHWFRAFNAGHMIPRSVWQSFAVAEIPGAYAELVELLGMLAGHELDPDAFNSPSSPKLNRTEYCFLSLFCDDESGVEWRFQEQPCPAIEREAMNRAERIAARLRVAGFRLVLPAHSRASTGRPSSVASTGSVLALH